MAYLQGQSITAADYNSLKDDVNEVYADSHAGETSESPGNYGYGETPTAATVSVTDSITAAQWTGLFSSLAACATHQGTSMGIVPSSVSIGQTIESYDGGTGLLAVISDVRANRFDVAGGQSTITSSGGKLTSSRGTSWTNQLQHIFTVDYGSNDNARHFFNTGGQIRFSGDRTGGSASNQNTIWTNFLTAMDTVTFDHTDTTPLGAGTGSSIGFFNLTSGYQTVYEYSTPSYGYVDNIIRIEAQYVSPRANGELRFRVTYISEPGPNVIDGTITSMIDEKRSTGAIVKASPTFATTTGLTAGT